jgi:hypothetical protein
MMSGMQIMKTNTTRLMTIVALAVTGAALAGCEKHDAASGDPSAFLGAWSCTAQLAYKFTTPPNTPDKSVSLELTRTFTGAGKALESTSVTASGKSSGCVSKWTADGTTATMVPEQTCSATVTMPDGAVREVTTRHEFGTANLSGATIHETGGADVEINEGAAHLVGTGTTATTCTRK